MKLVLATFIRKLADIIFKDKILDSKNTSNIIAPLGDKMSLIKLEEGGISFGVVNIFNHR